MPFDKIDANITGLAITEETSAKVLPAAAAQVWYQREPNSFDNFGGEISTVARRPFSPSRQRKKGTTTDNDVNGGFNEDLTQDNMQRPLQGFFFADLREQPQNLPINGTQRAVASITAPGLITGAAGFGTTAGFLPNHLVKVTGFANAINNGVFPLSAVAANTVTVTNAGAIAEPAPPAGVAVEAVGFQFAAGDITMTIAAGVARLNATAADFTTLKIIPGQWVFVGGDLAATAFATVSAGYARVKTIAAKLIEFDKTTFVAAADAGAAKTIQLYFGDVLKNESASNLIKTRYFQQQRTLGSDGVGIQSEYLEGCVANEATWNSPLADKVTLDLGFLGLNNAYRDGTSGPKTAVGGVTLVAAPAQEAFNTSSNVFRIRLAAIDPTTLNPTPYFARITEWTMDINNNATAAKAQGVIGGFDVIIGGFDFGGEMTAYFSTVAAINAIRNNADVTFDAIYSKKNQAIVMDVPLIGLGGGQLDIQQDAAIMLPLTTAAAESPFGHTALLTWFSYVPTAGVAS